MNNPKSDAAMEPSDRPEGGEAVSSPGSSTRQSLVSPEGWVVREHYRYLDESEKWRVVWHFQKVDRHIHVDEATDHEALVRAAGLMAFDAQVRG